MGFYEIVLFAYSIAGSASIGYIIVVIASPQTRRMPEQYRYGASILTGGVLTAAAIATTIGAEFLLQKEDLFFAILPITAAMAVLFAIIARFSLKPKAVIPQKTSIYTPTQKIGRIEVKQKIDETKKTEIEKLVEKNDFRKKETANVQMAEIGRAHV